VTQFRRSIPLRVLVVIGTRPEAIKLAPLIHALRAAPDFSVSVCITSQHTDLLTPMLEFFGVSPDHDLKVMTPGQTLAQVTTRVLNGIDALLAAEKFDLVAVQGDTTTAFAGALAAFYRHVRVVHVEAGLRSGDLARPFPEEANRRLADVLSAYLLAPTTGSRANLLAEGYPSERIFVTGNTGIDALLLAAELVSKEARSLPVELPQGNRLALVTAHRRESFGDGLRQICTALTTLLDRYPDLHLLYPVHPNPHVVEAANRYLRGRPRVHLVAPLEYPDFVRVLLRADLILSDSGGVQEEAPALGKRVLVLRETTERPEGIDVGAAELVGTDTQCIINRASALLDGEGARQSVVSPYGDGKASQRILEVLRTGALREPFALNT
jgi:UDP-N-acetylglucosamine 2-epimerase (non-hydrolysing)